jgi:hypothetical protein
MERVHYFEKKTEDTFLPGSENSRWGESTIAKMNTVKLEKTKKSS